MKLFNKLLGICVLFSSLVMASCNSTTKDNSFTSPTISLADKQVNLSIGQTYQMVATTSETSMLTYWFTRDSEIASVDSNGLVTALKVGVTVCYAQVGTNVAMCSINVTPYEPDSSLYVTCPNTNITLSIDDEYKLPIDVKYGYESVFDYSLRADILDSTICNFNDGKVKALSNGSTTLLLTVTYLESTDQLAFTINVE